jgi:hypothetical protein
VVVEFAKLQPGLPHRAAAPEGAAPVVVVIVANNAIR